MKQKEPHIQNDEPQNDVPHEADEVRSTENVVVDEPANEQAATEGDATEDVASTEEDTQQDEEVPKEGVVEADAPNEASSPDSESPHHSAVSHTRKREKNLPKSIGLVFGVIAVVLLGVSALLSQYYKGKVIPGVVVAGQPAHAKTGEQLRSTIEPKVAALTITLQSQEKILQPTFEEVGISVDAEATIANALQAKRQSGLFSKLAFWQKEHVPAVVAVDTTKLTQYIETNLPELSKPPTDSQLTFDTTTNQFIITNQADGEGVAIETLQATVTTSLQELTSPSASVTVEKRKPKITKKALEPLVAPANELMQRAIVLSGAGYTFQATPTDIAAWVTPTPKEGGSVELVIDQSKIQAYVEAVGKRISQPPQDRKVLITTTGEVVLQAGRDGTELTDREQLAKAIAIALEEKRDLSQQMNIQVAAFKTINMEAYDRWVEVDLSEQRTTLYNGATPLQSFVISSGLPQWPTVTGEFKVWHKNATQTMTGGSRATGDFYNLPNVTWVTYFYKDYGFHTAYWHNNFGQPMSHGCVNMREADAKVVYDFAPIGTTVIVHQ